MDDTFHKGFTLTDGTGEQVSMKSDECYEFLLLSPDDKEDAFTWDNSELRAIIESTDDCEGRRNEALQLLWNNM